MAMAKYNVTYSLNDYQLVLRFKYSTILTKKLPNK